MITSSDIEKEILYSRVLPATIMGNALEFFDFTIYAIFAVTIGKVFFPLESLTASLIANWGTFAVGFLMRPLGALAFGYLGDKFGRKFSLSGTILLTGAPTLVIGLLPGYTEIGMLAPVILILCRLMQGFCTGGEYNGAAIFALEHFHKLKPGTIGGAITGSCVIGALLATYSGYLISHYGEEWMWRLPFLFGAAVSFIGFFIRSFINETPEFTYFMKKGKEQKAPLRDIYTKYGTSAFLSFMVGALNGSLSYTLFGFLNVYMSKYLGIDIALAMKYNLLGLFFFMTFSPLAGYFLDTVGSTKAMQTAAAGVLIGAIPAFSLLQTLDPFYVLVGQAMLGILTASIAGASHGYMQQLFPTSIRYRGVSINFCAGMALFGGTAPLILTHCIEVKHYTLYVPALYLIFMATLFFLTISLLSKKESNDPQNVNTLASGELH